MVLASSEDIVAARQKARNWAVRIGFNLVDQTKIVTASSELARNVIVYAKSGTVRFQEVSDGFRKGLRIIFEDRGPGISDIAQAMTDGYTTGGGLGLGLSGARRLSNEFEITSTVGVGTRVAITRWKQ